MILTVENQPNISEQIGSTLQYQGRLKTFMQQTWQRRVMIDTLRRTPDPETRSSILQQPSITPLFGNEIQSGIIAAESPLMQLVNSSNLDDPAIDANIEQYLLQKNIESDSNIANIRLNQLPPELFAVPDDPQSLDTAINLIQSKGNSTIAEFAKSDPAKLPLIENILAAVLDNTNVEIGIMVLSDPKAASEYHKAWIKQEKNSGQKIVFSPSYQRAADIIRSLERRNGKNRTIARSISYGPPGRGKSEFYRALNRMDNKNTLVISGRPYLSYEELVASPQIVSRDKISSYVDLARVYQDLDGPTVAKMVYKLSHKYAQSISENATESQTQTLQEYWLKHIGLAPEAAQKLGAIKDIENLEEFNALSVNYETVKRTFIAHLLEQAAVPTLIGKSGKEQEYLQGLLITADKLGMRVVIDEAEKMYTGQQKGSESFAGLEDILTRSPGETVRVGNIEHRFSDDFCIDLTMNIPDIPKHILSRFGERAFYFEETPYDRLAIATVEMTGKDGKLVLSTEAQEKLAFLLAGAWPVIDRVAQDHKIPWDLRTFQSIMSNLAYKGHSKAVSVARALDDFRGASSQKDTGLAVIGKVLARFPVFQNRVKLFRQSATTDTPTASNSSETIPPLYSILSSAPTGIDQPLKLHVVNLTDSQIAQLLKSQNTMTAESSPDQISADLDTITLTDSGTDNPHLVITLPNNIDDVLYRAQISTGINNAESAGGNEDLELVSASAFGNIILVKKGNKYFAIDTFGTHVTDILSQGNPTADRVTSIIEKPVKVFLNPKGTYLYKIIGTENNVQLRGQRIGLKKDTNTNNTSVFGDFAIAGSQNQVPIDMQFTNDGNYAIVNYDDGTNTGKRSINILDVAGSERTDSPQFLLTEPLAGHNWQLKNFKNILFLYNSETKVGLRIT